MSKYIAIVTIMISTAFVAFNFQNCAKSSFTLREAIDSNGVAGLSSFPTSCREYYDNGACDDGTYTIDPDGNGAGMEPFSVYCDMTNNGRTLIVNAPTAGYDTIPAMTDLPTITTHGRLPDSVISLLLNNTQNSQYNNVAVDVATGQQNHTVSLNSNSSSAQGQYVIMDTANDLCDEYDAGLDGAAYTAANSWQFGNGSGNGFIGYIDDQTLATPYTGFTADIATAADKACNMVGPQTVTTYAKGAMWIVEDPNPGSACNQDPDVVNGGWTTWAPWDDSTACSDTCEKTQSRVRACTNPIPSAGGSDCALLDGGAAIDYQTISCSAGEGSCAAPPEDIDGGWTPWSNWQDSAPCDAFCNKQQLQSRTCTNPTPSGNGKDCSEIDGGDSSQIQLVQCQPGEGLCAPLPIHGGWTSWAPWQDTAQCDTSCTKPQERTRDCTNPSPQNGGNDCSTLDGGLGVDTQTASCQDGEGLCDTTPPIAGGWTNWTPFAPLTACTADCKRDVARNRVCANPQPQNGGVNCDDLDGGNAQEIQERECSFGEGLCQPEPINGGFTVWSTWAPTGPCDQFCKQHFTRNRTCTEPTPEFGGSDCSLLGDSIESFMEACEIGDGLCNGLANVIILGQNPENYGTHPAGVPIDRTIVFRNNGGLVATNLNYSGVESPYVFKDGNFPGTGGTCVQGGTLQPSSECNVVVTLLSTTPGTYDDTLELDYNDGQNDGHLERDLTGIIEEAVGGNADLVLVGPGDFGTTGQGVPTHLDLTVRNEGTEPATELSVPAIDQNFYLQNGNDPSTPGAFPGSNGTCGDTLAPGAECTIAVTCNPVAQGLAQAEFVLNFNAGTAGNSTSLPLICRADENCPTCPIDGQWGPWTEWVKKGECGEDCQKIEQRFRQCNNPAPQNGGADCVGEDSATRDGVCNPGEEFCPLLARLAITGDQQFGPVTVGETSPNQTFIVENVGEGRAAVNVQHLTDVATPNFNVVDGTCATTTTLAVNETCTIIYNYQPTAVGTHPATITVNYNDGEEDQTITHELLGTANAKPAMLFITGDGNFGERTADGDAILRTFTVENAGERRAESLQFAGVDVPFSRTGGTCSGTLDPGKTCTLIYRYSSPTPSPDGGHKDTLEFSYSDGVSTQSDPQLLTGVTTLEPANVTLDCNPKNRIEVQIGEQATYTCTLENDGGAPATGLVLANIDAPFSHTGGTCKADTVLLPQNATTTTTTTGVKTCTYVFTYEPTATNPNGDTQVLNVAYNSGNGPKTSAGNISGIGKQLPAKIDFIGDDNYGNITIGETEFVRRTFTVRNSGGTTATGLNLGGIQQPFVLGPGGTCGTTLAKDSSCTYVIDFRPTKGGPYSNDLILSFNDGAKPDFATKRLVGNADYVPARVTVSPASIDFKELEAGETATRLVTVTNSGGQPATSVVISAIQNPYTIEGSNCTSTIAAGESCNFNVVFAPTVGRPSPYTDRINVTYNSGEAPGSMAVTITGTAKEINPANIMLSCGSGFGTLVDGESQQRVCEVMNNGGSTATNVTYTGFTNPPFDRVGSGKSCGTSIAVGQTCNVIMRYTCRNAQAGDQQLTITYNDGTGKTLTSVDNLVGLCQPAVQAINGAWGPFGNDIKISDCTGGARTYKVRQYRECNTPPPSAGGQQCLKADNTRGLIEHRDITKECAIVAQWGAWGPWAETCEAGVKTRKRTRTCTPAGQTCKKENGQLATTEEQVETGTCPIDKANLLLNCPPSLNEGTQKTCTITNNGKCTAKNINITAGAPFSLRNTASSNCGTKNGVIGAGANCGIDVYCPKPLGSTSKNSTVRITYNNCESNQTVTDTVSCNGTIPEPDPVWGAWSSWTKGDCANGKRSYSRFRTCTPNGKKCTHSKTGQEVTTESESKIVADASCNVASCTVVPSIGTALPPASYVQSQFKQRSGYEFHRDYLPQSGNTLTREDDTQWRQFIKFEKCTYPDGKVEWKVADFVRPVKGCDVMGQYGYRGNNNQYTVPCLMDKNGNCIKNWLDGKDHGWSSCAVSVKDGRRQPSTLTDRVVNGKTLRFCDATCFAGENNCTGEWGTWTEYQCHKGYLARWRKCPEGKTCYDAVHKQCKTSMDEHLTEQKCTETTACSSIHHGNNLISVEAECYTRKYSNGGHDWKIINQGAASGGKALESTPDKGNFIRSTASSSPQAQYQVNFPSAGRYRVWVRGWGDADGSGQKTNSQNTNGEGKSDSVHVGINGVLKDSAKQMDYFPANRWHWSNDRRGTNNKAYVDVPSAGNNWINVWMREDGFKYDKLIFSKDTNYKPSGTGPN